MVKTNECNVRSEGVSLLQLLLEESRACRIVGRTAFLDGSFLLIGGRRRLDDLVTAKRGFFDLGTIGSSACSSSLVTGMLPYMIVIVGKMFFGVCVCVCLCLCVCVFECIWIDSPVDVI